MSGLQPTILWKLGSATFALIAIGASLCSYQRVADAKLLRQQLAAASTDARRAHDEITELTAQLSTSKEQLAAAQQEVIQDRQDLTTAKQQVTSETLQLLAASRPDLPVKLSFRHALLSQGEVAVIQNLSNRTLEINLDVQSPATGTHFQRALVINPGQMGQFGPQEGWSFASGQLVTLSNPAFRAIRQTIGR